MKWAIIAGKVKIWQTRLQTYIALSNFFMLFYIFIQDNKWLPWYLWFIIIILACSSLMYIDIKHIMPNALGYQWDKNKSFKRLEEKVDTIMEKIKL